MGRGKGKGKIKITKIQDDNHLHAAFSKRRTGLFRSADHLNKLTGAHNALIVFSPGNKAFSFGCPDVESVITRYKSKIPQNFSEEEKMQELQRHVYLERLDADLELLQNQLEFEKKRAKFLDQINEEGSEPNWWEDDVKYMSVDQLETLKVAMMDLQERVLNDQAELLKQEIQREPDPSAIEHDAASITTNDSTFADVPFDWSRALEDFLGDEKNDRDDV